MEVPIEGSICRKGWELTGLGEKTSGLGEEN